MGIMRLFGINVQAGITRIRIGLEEVIKEDALKYDKAEEKPEYQENAPERSTKIYDEKIKR